MVVVPSWNLVRVQLPLDGKPPRAREPVTIEQVGCVTETIVGADGIEGCGLITTAAEGGEVQPSELVTE